MLMVKMNLKLGMLALVWSPSCLSFTPTLIQPRLNSLVNRNTRLTAPQARPYGVSNADWEVVVAAELAARQKKYGPLAGIILAEPDIEANQLRVYEQLEEKRRVTKAANSRANRRSNSKKKKGKAVEMVDLSRPDNAAKEAPPPPPAPAPAPKGGFLEGLLEKTQAAFPEANVMARMQAEKMNTALEDAGMLEKLDYDTISATNQASNGASKSDASSLTSATADANGVEVAASSQEKSKSQLKKQLQAAQKRKRK